MRSINQPANLVSAAAEKGMSSIAVTDYCTLAGIHESYQASLKNKTKLIVGCHLNFTDNRNPVFDFISGVATTKPEIDRRSLIVLACNATGYKNILKMNFEAEKCKLEKASKIDKVSLVDWDILEKHSEGVICLTGDSSGIVSQDLLKYGKEKAYNTAKKLKSIFGDRFGLELQPNTARGRGADQFATNRLYYKLSSELGIKPVATSNCLHVKKEHVSHQDFLTAIKYHRAYYDGSRKKFTKPDFYLHSGDDIVKFFSRNFGDQFATSLCENSIYFADLCEEPKWTSPAFVTGDEAQLPAFPVKDEKGYDSFNRWVRDRPHLLDLTEDKQYMRYWCESNWHKVPKDKEVEYVARYEQELSVYEQLGFSSYMLITADFLRWARSNKVRVGPGRGSVGGSLVGYLLDIHKADPIECGLIFERFLNLEKNEYPDIDNDFDSVGREKVLKYITYKYGSEFVAHVSNFVSFTPKNAITDVISCLEIGGDRSEAFKIAKNITETIPTECKTVKSAAEKSPLFKEFLEDYPDVEEFAEMLIGLPRSYSTHAAGVVIGKYPLAGLVPLRYDDYGVIALEFEKNRTEKNGLVKIDFLGLETLNIIDATMKIIEELKEAPPEDPPDYNAYYENVYNMISDGNTFGVFQLGTSGGTIDLCRKIQPKNLEDLAVINALTRPGVPPAVRQSYIERRFGREEIEIPHPNLNRAVAKTMGYCVFEESFLWLAHDFCGWNLRRADKMRKISKLKAKGKHLLDELHEGYLSGAIEHSKVDEEFAEHIWHDWVIPLSGYAFNKSHAILYSMTSLHTAYLKANYPAAFMTANLMSETKSNAPQSKTNRLKVKHDMRKMGINIRSPHVNKSNATYKLIDNKNLVTGFLALRGVKDPAAQDIMQKQPFSSFEDFLLRVDSSKVRASVVEALVAVGAMDDFGYSRKSMFLYNSDLRKKLKSWKSRGKTEKFEFELPTEEWATSEIRGLELKYLGEALSGNKKHSYPTLFTNRGITPICEAIDLPDRTRMVVEGEVTDLFVFKVKNEKSKIFGEEVCRMIVEDLKGDQLPVVVFPAALAEFKKMYEKAIGSPTKVSPGFGMRFSATTNWYNKELSLVTQEIYDVVAPIPGPKDIEKKKVEIYSGRAKRKNIKKESEDITNDLLDLIVNDNE